MDWLNSYNQNGIFCSELHFVERFGMSPNSFCATFNDEPNCDLDAITDELIKSLIPLAQYIRRIVSKYTVVDGKRDAIVVGQGTDTSLEVLNSSASKSIIGSREFRISEGGTAICIVTTDKKIYNIDVNSISCRHLKTNQTEIEKEVIDIWNKLPKVKEKSKEATVNLVGFADGDYYTIESKIRSTKLNIEENYNDDFLPVFKDTIDFLNTRESGLVLYHGMAGTGKTSFIRHLITNYPHDYIIVPTSLTTRLADPDFITFMIDNSDSVFILEDCEQLLTDRSVNIFNGAIANILNMSDGLLSDIMNLKFICTFNADIRTIDQALLRKGRCYAKYEFKELCEEKVKSLNDKYDLGIETIKPMTLAEIYNVNRTEYTEKKIKRKIGF